MRKLGLRTKTEPPGGSSVVKSSKFKMCVKTITKNFNTVSQTTIETQKDVVTKNLIQ